MARDYYDILDLSKSASDSDIKSSYRKLAMKYHPDRNPGDKKAEENFREITESYEILKDPQKRAAYDQYGHAAFSQSSGGGSGGGFSGFGSGGFSDIFEDMFGIGFATMATRLGSAFGRAFKATAPKLQAPQPPLGRRNLITLSFRMDGLVAMCAKDAIIHYVPQDLAIIIGIYLSFKSYSASVNSCGKKIEDPDAALAAWAEKKGVDVASLDCRKGSTWKFMYPKL